MPAADDQAHARASTPSRTGPRALRHDPAAGPGRPGVPYPPDGAVRPPDRATRHGEPPTDDSRHDADGRSRLWRRWRRRRWLADAERAAHEVHVRVANERVHTL